MSRKFVYILLFVPAMAALPCKAQPSTSSSRVALTVPTRPRLFVSEPGVQQSFKDSLGVSAVFADVERGVVSENVAIFSKFFSSQVYVNLRDVESGYLSASQATYVLKNFFGARSTLSFRLSTVGEDGETPYATGSGSFMHRGKREVLQLYVSLTRHAGQWLITQFSVY